MDFNWREDLNEVHDLGTSIRYLLFATGSDVKLSLDEVNYISPNTSKGGVSGWDITIPKEVGKTMQYFRIQDTLTGCLAISSGLSGIGVLDVPNPILPIPVPVPLPVFIPNPVPAPVNVPVPVFIPVPIDTPTPVPTPQPVPVPVFIPVPVEQGNKTIQLAVYQNCSNNDGVYFRVETVLPDTNTSSYNIQFVNTGSPSDAPIDVINHNTMVIRNHDSGLNGFFKIIVTRADCKPCTYESYSTTCNHDGDPTDCPDNERNISINGGNRLLQNGEVFDISVNGNITCNAVYYNTNINQLSQSQFQITGYPFKLHYQPSCGEACHGWTELYQQEQ
jgi:hypothetical protein